jgi:serine phosphatase RsbU (regulator of sigma subunit)/pSer/pThr/pTyr-binding forkhead associated (FHA) protein
MPTLHILKGPDEGNHLPLDGERFIFGRDPGCWFVIPVTSVSRQHAQIVRLAGQFFIEDNNSRNGTFVNNQQINARTPLKHNDRIRICDCVAAFVDQPAKDTQPAPEEHEETDGNSTVEASLNHTSHMLLETQPAEKLRLLVEITTNLSKVLELQSLLPKIADSLFQVFRQADRCFVIQQEGDKLVPRVVKARRPADEANASFSKSIVRKCMAESKAFLSGDASKDERIQLSQSVVDFRIRSVMCAPLTRADGKAFGVIQLDTQDHGKKFKEDDLKLLCGIANQASISMENSRLLDDAVRQEREKERSQRDLQLAKKVQESFLPAGPPKVAGYEFWGFYESAREVGGDYFGYIPLPGGKMVCAIGDVAGKGIPASLLMTRLSSDIRYAMLSESDPGRAVAHLNDSLYEFTSKMDRFVTLVAAILDPATHAVTMVSAGHASPLLWRPATGQLVDALPADFGGPPLGMTDGIPFDSYQITLGAGETLVLFTDGVNESMNVQGKQFGMEGVLRIIKAAGDVSAEALGEKLVAAVKQHAAGRDAFDDLTVVVVSRRA